MTTTGKAAAAMKGHGEFNISHLFYSGYFCFQLEYRFNFDTSVEEE